MGRGHEVRLVRSRAGYTPLGRVVAGGARSACAAALFIVVVMLLLAASARAANITITPSSFTTSLSTNQAGAHPDLTTTFSLDHDSLYSPIGGTPRDLSIELPKGLVGAANATPTCPMGTVSDTQARCPESAAVGVIDASLYYLGLPFPFPQTALVYNVTPYADEPAALGFFALYPVRLDTKVRSDGDYGITTTGANLTEAASLLSSVVTLWGVPADHNGPGPFTTTASATTGETYGGRGLGTRRAFFTNPTECSATSPISSLAVDAWQAPGVFTTASFDLGPITGCDRLTFAPTIDVRPDSRTAGAPTGLAVTVSVPQNPDPSGLATPNVKDIAVTLPSGMALSPSAADGLGACSDAQIGLKVLGPATCPDSSKIGTVEVTTPLLDDPLEGEIFLGTQKSQDPQSGEMYRMFLQAAGSGVRVKLPGSVKVDPVTGQLTTTFASNPQVPFDSVTVRLFGGSRAPLVNPSSCGTKITSANITSWAGSAVDTTSSYEVDRGCPTGQFAPTFEAGTLNPQAGGYSPFTMTIRRTDADQDISSIAVSLPSGVLAALGSVPLCAEADAAAGTCGSASQIGTTTVSSGAGPDPFTLGGKVYISGPYKDAPFSLSIVVPAKAGPFDLGTVVVRSPLIVDAAAAKASAPADPLPTILGGVPLHIKMINVTLDRPGFTFNATSCAKQTVGVSMMSTGGATSTSTWPYQAAGCASLPVKPDLALSFTGKGATKDGTHPAVVADLNETPGQANLKQVKVTLPLSIALDPDNAQGLCTPEQATARACPDASIVGHATATTPALHEPLAGPVYFVENTRLSPSGRVIKTLPKLWLRLSGEGVPLDLFGTSEVDSSKRLVSTFDNVPDAPVSSFHLDIDGGKHGILVANTDVCLAPKATTAVYTGQNGVRTTKSLSIKVPDCTPHLAKTVASSTSVALSFSGLRAGKLTVTSPLLAKGTKTITTSDTATLTAKLTAKAKATIKRTGSVTVKIRAVFDPTTGKNVTMTKTVTVKRSASTAKKQ
jgi:hypothetical protein